MRKILTIWLVTILVISFCGCRDRNKTSCSGTSSINTVITQSVISNVSSEALNSDESSESKVSSKQTQSADNITSKMQNSSSESNAISSMGHGQADVEPVPESLKWDPIYGEKNWEFVTTDPSRLQGSAYYMLSFHIDKEYATDIHTGGYILPEEATYDILSKPSHEFDGKMYYRDWGGDLYSGNFFITQGEEDTPILELRCYDGPGQNFLTNELKFKRLDNNTLQYVGEDFEEFQLRTGDIFKR